MLPLQLLVASLIGWCHREQHEVIAYLREENRVLKAHLRNQRLRLTDDDRRAWPASARLLVVGFWRKLRQLSRPTPFFAGIGN